MSRSTAYDNNNNGLYINTEPPYSHRRSPDDDYENLRAVAASSGTGPWSPYNRRHDPCHPFTYTPTNALRHLRAFESIDSTARRGYVFEDTNSSFEPVDYLTPTDAATYRAPSRAPNPRPSFDPSAAKGTFASNTLPGDHGAHVHITTCAQCNQTFTGTYQSGNFARHVRQKHADVAHRLYECEAPNCARVYQRKDARLKHMRIRHPELCLPPGQRRRPEASSPRTLGRSYATSAPDQFSHVADLDESASAVLESCSGLATSSTGTIPSTLDYEVKFSRRQPSSQTYASSGYGHYDANFLSPYSPSYRRPTSLPPDVAEESSPIRHGVPSPKSLQDQSDSCIDPAMLNSPGGDTVDVDVYAGYVTGRWEFDFDPH